MKRALTAAGALLAFPATAAAQTPPAPPAPPTAKLSITAQDGITDRAVLAGRSFTARVVMKPYVEGEGAVLRVYKGAKKLSAKTLKFKSVAGGTAGVATLKLKYNTAQSLTLKVSHRATAGLATTVAKPLKLTIATPYAGPGARGPAVKWLQDRLAKLHYVTSRSGVYDDATGRAIMAWRKVAGYSRQYTAGSDVYAGIAAGKGVFQVRHPGDGRHLEARIGKQVLALIDGGKVQHIFHTSTGAPATPTVRGKFRVYLKTPGTNAKGMVDSSYFIRGYAVHGYASVPPYNASHGCLRVPIPNARFIYDWLRYGDVVWVEE